MIRLVLILGACFLIVYGIDFYVQNILSPVQSGLAHQPNPRRTNYQNEERRTPNPPSANTIEPTSVLPEEEKKLACASTKSFITFKDYDMLEHEISFEICDSILNRSIEFRENLKSNDPSREYVKFIAPFMEPIVEVYRKKIKELGLDRIKAAEYVMASIQNIPYTLVHNFSHEAVQNPQTYIDLGQSPAQANKIVNNMIQLHKDINSLKPLEQIGGCLGEVNYGLVTPIEMFINKMGDCDSRSIALFIVLRQLGYDVIQLSSSVFQHAIIGLNLPGANHGNIYYLHQGRKYYIWETTAFHPIKTRLGVHKDGVKYMSNSSAWKISLK